MDRNVVKADEYVMPPVRHGQVVAWYPPTGRQEPESAIVIRVAPRNVHLSTATRGVREAVRHVSDPKLRLNPEQREMGAWDYTDDYKTQLQEFQQIREHIAALQRQVNVLVTQAARGPSEPENRNTGKK